MQSKSVFELNQYLKIKCVFIQAENQIFIKTQT